MIEKRQHPVYLHKVGGNPTIEDRKTTPTAVSSAVGFVVPSVHVQYRYEITQGGYYACA